MTKYRFEWTEGESPNVVVIEAPSEQVAIEIFKADFGRDVKPVKVKK